MECKVRLRCKGDTYWCVPWSANIVFAHRKADLPKGGYPIRVARWWMLPNSVYSWGWSVAQEAHPNLYDEITVIDAAAIAEEISEPSHNTGSMPVLASYKWI